MEQTVFPVIDPVATGQNIIRLRKERGLSVKDIQFYFGFEEPQAVYKWQRGRTLPSVDNLYALSSLLKTPMNDIIVSYESKYNIKTNEQSVNSDCSSHFINRWGYGRVLSYVSTIMNNSGFVLGKKTVPQIFGKSINSFIEKCC